MYTWYSRAVICYVYLADVPSTVDVMSDDSELTKTEWVRRGWTLQELLAPSQIIFYSNDWQNIGTKESLGSILSTITHIEEEYLRKKKPLSAASIAKRMSWASRRKTSRPEDIAYCLMGIFEVNMPMLYGEGEKAFIRLQVVLKSKDTLHADKYLTAIQEEIMKHSDDNSLFAWVDESQSDLALHGLLANHPKCFGSSGSIVSYQQREVLAPFSMTNRGLCIKLHLTKLNTDSMYTAALECPVPMTLDGFLLIYLKELPGNRGQFARVKVGYFGESYKPRTSDGLRTIYVRQVVVELDVDGIYPHHIFQLRTLGLSSPDYRVTQAMKRDTSTGMVAIPLERKATSWDGGNGMMYHDFQSFRKQYPQTCKIVNKQDTRALFAIKISHQETDKFIVLLGSVGSRIGFDVMEHPIDPKADLFREFRPISPGSEIAIRRHRVCVLAEPVVYEGRKYYMIDIEVKDLLENPKIFFNGTSEDLDTNPKETAERTERFRRPFDIRRFIRN